jgi:site-specific recombinase XerD
MTPRLTRALSHLRSRGYAIGDHDFVFVSELTLDSPVSERPIRHAFKVAADETGLKPIKMYNLRHSFGTTLARNGVDIRTIQALMRHDRLSTTE